MATGLGPIFSVCILLPRFLLKKGCLHFQKYRLRFWDIRNILLYGFPSFIMEFSIGTVTVIYNFAIVRYGYSGMGLAAYLVLILLTLFLGMAEGLQSVFSYLNAVGEQHRSRAMLRSSAVSIIGLGILCYGLILPFSHEFFSIFTPDDLELISFASSRCPIYFCGFFLARFNICQQWLLNL